MLPIMSSSCSAIVSSCPLVDGLSCSEIVSCSLLDGLPQGFGPELRNNLLVNDSGIDP